MNEIKRTLPVDRIQQLRSFANHLLNVQEGENMEDKLRQEYNIGFSDFCRLVWDILDYVPVITKVDGSEPSHVLGAEITPTRSNAMPVFLSIVSKKA